jgi:hypothetical protein
MSLAQSAAVVDVQQQDTWYRSGATTSTTTLTEEPALQVDLTGQWSQTGVRYTDPQDWSRFHGFHIRVRNLESYPVALGLQWDVNPTGSVVAGSNIDLAPLEESTFYVDFSGTNYPAIGMRSPLSVFNRFYKHRFPWGSQNLNSVYRWQVYLRDRTSARVQIGSLHGLNRNAAPSLSGFVDQFGQYAHGSWSWKVQSPEQIVAQRQDEDVDLAANPMVAELTGSATLAAAAGQGGWRIHSKKGKPYFISPEGRRFWSLGVCHVINWMDTIVQNRESMFQDLPGHPSSESQFYGTSTQNGQSRLTYSHYSSNLWRKYGEAWRQESGAQAMRRLPSWGFNTFASGSDHSMNTRPMPFTFTLSTRDYPVRISGASFDSRSVPDPFVSDFQTWSRSSFVASLGSAVNNRMLMGCYVDGETPWGLRSGGLSDQYWLPLAVLRTPQGQAAKEAFVSRLTSRYSTIQSLNTSWGTSYASWNALRANTNPLSADQVTRARADLSTFLQTYVDTYAAKVRGAIKSIKSDLLYLGGRESHATSPNEAFKGMELQADVVSVTIFDDPATVPWAYLNSLTKPVLITEFSFTTNVGNSFPQVVFPRIEAESQAQRAAKTRQFLNTALGQKNVIGAHWFNYIDQPLTSRAGSLENMGFGLVDVTDRPYPELIDAFRSFSRQMYSTRGL